MTSDIAVDYGLVMKQRIERDMRRNAQAEEVNDI